MIIVIAAALLAPAACADDAANIAPRCTITSSPLPNVLWAPGNVADGDLGPTKGWLGEWLGPKNQPWLRFTLPQPFRITAIEVVPASFTETGKKNRFLRPRTIYVDFTSGGGTQRLTFELDDNETQTQRLEFDPATAEKIDLIIGGVYDAQAVIRDSVGFQEVRIFSDNAPQTGGGKTGAGSLLSDEGPDAGEEPEYESGGVSGDDGRIDAGEREILDLLRALLEKLEKKFLED
jgi:hypothetical protein